MARVRSAAPRTAAAADPIQVTLLELVTAIGEVTEDDAEVVATVLSMLSSGRARLCGNFAGTPPERLAG